MGVIPHAQTGVLIRIAKEGQIGGALLRPSIEGGKFLLFLVDRPRTDFPLLLFGGEQFCQGAFFITFELGVPTKDLPGCIDKHPPVTDETNRGIRNHSRTGNKEKRCPKERNSSD